MDKGYTMVVIAYVLAGLAALGSGISFHDLSPILIVALADGIATIVVFVFSVFLRNSSIYDPYWSIAPIPIALFWILQPGGTGFGDIRHVLIFSLVCIWSCRLTINWAKRWHGLSHEDWRYRNIRKQTKGFYWPVSFLGIHLMPTIIVFLGCLSLWPALTISGVKLNFLDGIAALITAGAILTEAAADLQMDRFRNDPKPTKKTIPPGLWSLSRHPNYLGEVAFWWGLYVFVLACNPSHWWTIIGPGVILMLFLAISIPLMEQHLKERNPEYAQYQQQVSSFFPVGGLLKSKGASITK
jgi:steroid 5-alpha reductase family enzyme